MKSIFYFMRKAGRLESFQYFYQEGRKAGKFLVLNFLRERGRVKKTPQKNFPAFQPSSFNPSSFPEFLSFRFKYFLGLFLLPGMCFPADPVFEKFQPQIEASVDKGLEYLAARQQADGSFVGENGDTTGIVSLAGMAFLSTGDTPGQGKWGKPLAQCMEYVLTAQRTKEGDPYAGMFARDPHREKMYSHCISTLFLSELSGMVAPEQQVRIREAQAKALALILKAQNVPKDERNAGGWRYLPDANDSDLSLTGWALMALKSARLNGADVPEDNINKAVKYILNRHRENTGQFGYQGDMDHAESLTGAGLLCLELTGHHGKPQTLMAGRYIQETRENLTRSDFEKYGNYYNAQGMFQLGGEFWEKYATWMYEHYPRQQKEDGSWEGRDGPLYNTSLMILAFTVPYRQLPIYQRDETAE